MSILVFRHPSICICLVSLCVFHRTCFGFLDMLGIRRMVLARVVVVVFLVRLVCSLVVVLSCCAFLFLFLSLVLLLALRLLLVLQVLLLLVLQCQCHLCWWLLLDKLGCGLLLLVI